MIDAQTLSTVGPREEPTRRRRYKTEVAAVSPETSRATFDNHDSCFLGVSLENSNFAPSKLESMVKWISRRFKHCTVLVGDSIHRITLESTAECSPTVARATALELGQQFIDDNQALFDFYGDETEFSFLRCSDVQVWEEYDKFHTQLQALFKSDSEFLASVESFGRAYHGKHSSDVGEAEFEARADMSSAYFLEEFAIFACLQKRDLPVMVYPGSFSTLSEIAAGLHKSAPSELQELIVVSLHLKGK
ncbi:tRNA-dependent cyclodipeptide synthase [Williamsia herbipolensis]|uniref:tRNA-dependent cyclodipeptide synthase n=1 Tax=Williamsia herbipolensis TaxID=1603258 RepID=UPI0009E3EBBF|nr:tRNA-dependent cyclodipeptide synthase [Williamsia herbipolensis]